MLLPELRLSAVGLTALAATGARPAGPPPRPSAEPVTAQRVASNTGVIMVAGQKIALGRIHARQIVTVHVAADTITIDLGDDTRTVRRTTTQPGPQHQSPAAPQGRPFFLGHLKACPGTDSSRIRWD